MNCNDGQHKVSKVSRTKRRPRKEFESFVAFVMAVPPDRWRNQYTVAFGSEESSPEESAPEK